MVAIIVITIMIIGSAVGMIRETSHNAKSFKKRDEETGTWIDFRGRTIDVATGHVVSMEIDYQTRDLIKCDTKTGTKRNISEERREREFQEKRKNHGAETVMVWNRFDKHMRDPINGVRYRDYETGNFYVIKEWSYNRFYMDLNTKKLVRKTDDQKITDRFYETAAPGSVNYRDKRSVGHPYWDEKETREFIEKVNRGEFFEKAEDMLSLDNDIARTLPWHK